MNPLPITRSRWWYCADTASARCVVFESVLPDEAEHRHRVEARNPDILGLRVPTWQDVCQREYAVWDEDREGPRTLIDMTDPEQGRRKALDFLGLPI